MSYHFDGEDLVIDGFEQGIAESPYKGIADMRNVNIISSPQEAHVTFATQAMTLPPTVSAVSVTAVASTDVCTVSSTSGWFNGMALTFNSLTGGGGLVVNNVYWVGNLSGNTFKVYKNPYLDASNLIDITTDLTVGTLSSFTFSGGLDSTTFYSGGAPRQFILDTNGRAWMIDNINGSLQNRLIFIGNKTLTGTTGRAIKVFENNLIVLRTSAADALSMNSLLSPTNIDINAAYGQGWIYGWITPNSTTLAKRPALVGQDNALYFGGGSGRLASVITVPGSTFAADTPATFSYNFAALKLPAQDDITALGEQGTSLLIGGLRNFLYPWDRISTSFSYPVILAESLTTNIVTSVGNAYIFTGNRGRIYVSNGSNVKLYLKIPDYLSGTTEPYFSWGDTAYNRNQLYFSFTAKDNAGNAINNFAGVWAFDTLSNAFRYTNKLSYGTYAGSVPVILPSQLSSTPGGAGLYTSWVDGSSNVGVDTSATTPYTNYEAYIETDLIPIGTYYKNRTLKQIEYKLGKPLVAGESVRISYRTNIADAYTTVFTSNATGAVSDASPVNFQKSQWLQLRIELSSTASNPSFVRLREIRIR